MTIRELLERRSKIVEEMRGITNLPTGEAGDLSAEQSTRFDSLKSELATVEKNIERQTLLDEAERRMQGTPLNSSGDGQFDSELRKFSLLRAICSQVPDLASRVDCGRERELSAELAKRSGMSFQGVAIPMQVFEKRVITTALPSGGPGSNLIATDLMSSQYIDILRSKLVIKQLGARVLSGLVGNVDIPKLKTSSTAGWFAENAAIGLSDPEFAKVSLTPKHVGARTEFSRNMLLQSSPDIENLIRDDFAQILAAAVDRAAIKGGGSNEPSGLLVSGLNTSVSIGTTPTWAKILSIIELVELGNAEGNAWLTSPDVVRKLRSTIKETGQPEGYIQDDPNSLAGYPLATTNLMPPETSPATGRSLIFGNFSEILLGYWSVFDLLVNPYESTAYSKGNVQVRGIITMDVGIRHIQSFAASINILT